MDSAPTNPNDHNSVSGTPRRVQRKRAKGWKMPPDTVSVTRPGQFGNPFPVDCYGHAGAVDRFRRLMTGHMSTREMSESSYYGQASLPFQRNYIRGGLHLLRGKNLACWCALDKPCHADVLLELANTGSTP